MPRLQVIALLLLSCSMACKMEPTEDDTDEMTGGSGAGGQGMQANAGQGGGSGAGSGGMSAATSGTGGEQGDPGVVQDAGMGVEDPGSMLDAAIDGAVVGAIGSGSCCTEHDTPGCSNADLQVCVCEMVPSCCTEAWNAPCVLFVQQKYCQPGVRECVCGDGEGQWQQHSCCELDWTETFCDEVAETKCGAVPGCM